MIETKELEKDKEGEAFSIGALYGGGQQKPVCCAISDPCESCGSDMTNTESKSCVKAAKGVTLSTCDKCRNALVKIGWQIIKQ